MPADVVLLVEDEPDLLEDMPMVLSTYELEVRATSDYDEALRQVRSGMVRAVILDAKMPPGPDMDAAETDDGRLTGVIVCKRIRAIDAEIPVLFVTSLSDPRAHAIALQAGANEVVEKPVYPDEIVQRLRRLLRRAGSA
jgi:DNA-binding response OmpR family regulator